MSKGIELTVNGQKHAVDVPPVKRLSEVLREDLKLTGTKVGCNAGDCGACTVTLNGRQICSCLTPVAQADGARITTVEGLADKDSLGSLQRAFSRHGAAQCGICSPGMLMAATSLLDVNRAPSREQVEDALGGDQHRRVGEMLSWW